MGTLTQNLRMTLPGTFDTGGATTINSNFGIIDAAFATSALVGKLGLVIDLMRDYPLTSGSAKATTGSIALGSNQLTLAAAIDFENGQGIDIVGAGAGGANLYTTVVSGGGTTTLTLAANASTTHSGAVVKHDDTVQFQTALTALYNAGGGKLLTNTVPGCWFNINNIYSSSYFLSLPVYTALNGMMPIIIEGCSFLDVFNTGIDGSPSVPSTVITADGTTAENGGYIFGVPPGGGEYDMSTYSISVRNIHFVLPSPTAGVSAIDTRWAWSAAHYNVLVDTGAAMSVPTGNTNYAFRMPYTSNANLSYLENCWAAFAGVACTFSEHQIFNNFMANSCYTVLMPDSGIHESAGNINACDCAVFIDASQMSEPMPCSIDFDASIQYPESGLGTQIIDPNNYLYGRIRYELTLASNVFPGRTAAFLSRSGAQHLKVEWLGGNNLSTGKTLDTSVDQNQWGMPVELSADFTLNPTSGAAATVSLSIGFTSGSLAEVAQISIPATGLAGQVQTVKTYVPEGWYYQFAVSNATYSSTGLRVLAI